MTHLRTRETYCTHSSAIWLFLTCACFTVRKANNSPILNKRSRRIQRIGRTAYG
jgi:hypothetical protein